MGFNSAFKGLISSVSVGCFLRTDVKHSDLRNTKSIQQDKIHNNGIFQDVFICTLCFKAAFYNITKRAS